MVDVLVVHRGRRVVVPGVVVVRHGTNIAPFESASIQQHAQRNLRPEQQKRRDAQRRRRDPQDRIRGVPRVPPRFLLLEQRVVGDFSGGAQKAVPRRDFDVFQRLVGFRDRPHERRHLLGVDRVGHFSHPRQHGPVSPHLFHQCLPPLGQKVGRLEALLHALDGVPGLGELYRCSVVERGEVFVHLGSGLHDRFVHVLGGFHGGLLRGVGRFRGLLCCFCDEIPQVLHRMKVCAFQHILVSLVPSFVGFVEIGKIIRPFPFDLSSKSK
mmetsp:Transcript_32296/g.75952  ORF Transcript_32296/g.75952 Transcript_32296/m.75952 type:complete len:268 (+) Transcript_32296:1391-2194(+)